MVRGTSSYLIALNMSMQCPLLLTVTVGLRQGSALKIKKLSLWKSQES
jgi:hypothetical protein